MSDSDPQPTAIGLCQGVDPITRERFYSLHIPPTARDRLVCPLTKEEFEILLKRMEEEL